MRSLPRMGMTCFGTGGTGTGLSTYVNQIVGTLEAAARDFEIDILHPPGCVHSSLGNQNVHRIPLGVRGHGALAELRAHHFHVPQIARERKWDLFFAPVERRLPARLPCRTLVTIQDLAAFRVPFKYGLLRGIFNRSVLPRIYARADAVLCPSFATRRDLLEYTALDACKIEVQPLGVDRQVYHPHPQPDDDEVLARHQIHNPYLLYVSRIEHPGKNHVRLLRAFRSAIRQGLPHTLVIAGRPWRGAEKVLEGIRMLGLEQRVIVTGFVSIHDLPALYRQAELFVFPSLYEGFGIPLLEAMASGTAVACSTGSALPEVGGDAVSTFDPQNHDEMAAVLIDLLQKPRRRRSMEQKGLARSGTFTWNRTTRSVVASIRRLLELPPLLPEPIQQRLTEDVAT